MEIQMDDEALIEKYGMVVDQKMDVDGETLTIEAVIYDMNWLYVPCTFETIRDRNNLPDVEFCIGDEENSIGVFTTLGEKEDGLLHGFYLVSSTEPIEQGSKLVISNQCRVRDQVEILLDHDMSELVKEVKVEDERVDIIDAISVSALSITVRGQSETDGKQPVIHVTMVKKDGSEISYGQVGADVFIPNEETFTNNSNFAEPVDLDDMDHILLDTGGEVVKNQL